MSAPFVKISIEGLEDHIASLCSNYVTKDEFFNVINSFLSSLDVTSVLQPKHQEVTENVVVGIDSAVVYSNLENETDVALVSLPVINNKTRRITFLARRGGMKIVPNGYGLPTRNTIDGCFGVTIGVGEYASAVGEGETATFVMKKVARKFETVDLVSDGVDTWYII